MTKIKDLTPSTSSTPSTQGTVATQIADVHYGSMLNGIPSVQIEPFGDIDNALAFAATLIGSYSILYIEYQGLKLGVNA